MVKKKKNPFASLEPSEKETPCAYIDFTLFQGYMKIESSMVIIRKRCWALDPSGWDNAPLKCKQTVSSIVLIISNFLFEGVTPSSLQMNFPPPTPSPPLLLIALLWMLLPSLLIKAGINLPESWGTGPSAGNLSLWVSACGGNKDLTVSFFCFHSCVFSDVWMAVSRAWLQGWALPILILGK